MVECELFALVGGDYDGLRLLGELDKWGWSHVDGGGQVAGVDDFDLLGGYVSEGDFAEGDFARVALESDNLNGRRGGVGLEVEGLSEVG